MGRRYPGRVTGTAPWAAVPLPFAALFLPPFLPPFVPLFAPPLLPPFPSRRSFR
ncbi:hypothetical protein [Kitasatospora purpeofusca]|uniref:hypothetical protein n=1 Tax=Kitasatospora purpeofusca TaxID=67352 RepID=UPI00382D5A88